MLQFWLLLLLPAQMHCQWRIIGGRDAKQGEIPYMTSIRLMTSDTVFGGGHLCGGVLLNNVSVLTVAHCLVLNDNMTQFNPSSLRVVGGNVNKSIRLDGTVFVGKVKSLKLHPKFSFVRKENDIALIELAQAVPKSLTSFQPIPIATSSQTVGTNCWMIGWGETSATSVRLPDIAQITNVSLVSREDCMKVYENLSLTMLCSLGASTVNIRGACYVDSGGPVVCNGMLVGLVSFGKGCGAVSVPDVSTDVHKFQKWIDKNLFYDKSKATMKYCSHVSILSCIGIFYSLFCR